MNDVRSYPQINLRLHPDLRHWVQTKALSDRRSVNTWLTMLIEREQQRESQNENGHATGNLGG